jgi:hypothetical protein
MANVAVFAGALTFGTLLSLPDTLAKSNYISLLLSIAFVLFVCSLFASIGIRYLLRGVFDDDQPHIGIEIACMFHIALIILLLLAGFALLNVVLINIGQKAVGIVGNALLCLVPVWFFVVTYVEWIKKRKTNVENARRISILKDGGK